MKRTFMALAAMLLAAGTFAQTTTDSSYNAVADTAGRSGPDTLRVGNFIIVKQSKNRGPNNTETTGKHHRIIVLTGPHDHDSDYYTRHNTFTTNWLVFDLGFANVNDKTNYAEANSSDYLRTTSAGEKPFTQSDFKLRTKSSNVNIWVVMQRLNIAKNALNLKYGVGLEMFNFRYENDISYNKTPAYIYRDTVDFSKDKLYAGYITAPLMVNINPWPNKKRLTLSFGASAGYLVGSHTKQISNERGKQKTRGDFDLNKWRFAYVAELGIGPVRLYGSYSINPLHGHDLKQYPYAVGLRFSSW
jgi:hypothetical protein